MAVVIRFKRGQSTSWESKNLLLGPGEPGFELDTKQLKIGDGTTVWNELPYINDNERLQTIEEALQDVYTKSDIDSKLTALFRYKGSKESYSDLPEADENQTGDVWNIENADETHSIKAGDNVAWNGSQWDVLSGVFDLSDYVKKDGNKQLSTEDYTTEEKQKLGGIEDGAQVNEVTSQEFSELEERVGSLETDAETLAKADGSNATGKWIAGANEADQLATPRTINGAEFDGTKDISTNWTWDRCINPHYNDTPKTYKILTYDGQTDGHTSTYICCASSYGSESFTFILNFNYQKDLCNITGTLPANMQIKSNKNGVYISIQKYVEFYMTCIRGGKNSNLFSQYAFTEEEIPEDAVEPQITEMQVALKGEAGQIVGFDEDGQVISIDADSLINGPKYGVSGVGGSSPTLTRLWDSVGLTAAVGTDTQEVTNDFDNLPPFNRRKCVGTWSEPDATGKAHFTVKAYYGDPDYTEDGTMGDYVAVEVEPFYYIQDMENGIWGVSPKYQPGWKIHPVCIDKKTQTVRAKTYLPCYRMAIEKNADTGKGVSLPDLYPVGNSYYQLKTWAHNYNTAGYLEPAEVRNYEELLFTIEFATTNSQSIMAGATSL